MRRVVAYVDGFNLYHGLKAKHARKYLWLDLEALARKLLKPGQQLASVRYFTASVRADPPALARQSAYLGALGTHTDIEIILGRFQQKTASCRSCGSNWITYEEKETDVSIAVSLIEDGVNDRFDTALLISADSDLCPAVHALKRLRPQVRVIAAFPPQRRSDDLRRSCDASFTIGHANLRQSLLPDVVARADGYKYRRPARWR
ncbi:MAG: NYN domain-containing protein [Streptomycetales bacterium]